MDMSTSSNSSAMMAMSGMRMTFFTSTLTPLYSDAWTPTGTASYAATCIFLILVAALFRGLLVAKAWKETAWLDAEFNRRYVVVVGKPGKAERIARDDNSGGSGGGGSGDVKRMVLTENGVEEDVMVVKKRSVGVRPWRLSVDPLRAVMDTVLAGVAYLLMLAVMTLNVGYFMSVLAGAFLGSLAVGRYSAAFEHAH